MTNKFIEGLRRAFSESSNFSERELDTYNAVLARAQTHTNALVEAARLLRKNLDVFRPNGMYLIGTFDRDQAIMDVAVMIAENQQRQQNTIRELTNRIEKLEGPAPDNHNNAPNSNPG